MPHARDPPPPLLEIINARGLRLVRGAMECLGTIVGLDQTLMSQWVADQITAESHTQLFSTLLHPSLPVQSAMAILRLSALPQMSYLLRTLKPTITAKAAALFDAKVFETATYQTSSPAQPVLWCTFTTNIAHSTWWFWSA